MRIIHICRCKTEFSIFISIFIKAETDKKYRNVERSLKNYPIKSNQKDIYLISIFRSDFNYSRTNVATLIAVKFN